MTRSTDVDRRQGPRGWYRIDGVQEGETTLERQAAGLEYVRRAAIGGTVLDLGCAEGCMMDLFLEGGARRAHGIDYSPGRLAVARRAYADRWRDRFVVHDVDLDSDWSAEITEVYDVVLALGVVQKVRDPWGLLAEIAAIAGSVVAVRVGWPVFRDARSGNRTVDVVAEMARAELNLVYDAEGYPRGRPFTRNLDEVDWSLVPPYDPGDAPMTTPGAWLGVFERSKGWSSGS